MPKHLICSISGEEFEISDKEIEIRNRLSLPLPTKKPKYVFQELLAFWQHFSIHKRKCDATNEDIISVFDEYCPYPVWNKDYWFKNAAPPSVDFDFSKNFFEQLWDLFQGCPIPHNIGTGNENSEYTDDCWYSKNSYLVHSMVNGEDVSYSYRMVRCKDCQYCVFSYDSELCVDMIYSHTCYNMAYCLYSKNCRDSSFLFDCRNCADCICCWNLRNKKYCIGNKQYTKEEYEELISKIKNHMHKTGEKNKFFPKHFAANPYDESLAGFYFPLSEEEQIKQGFRTSKLIESKQENHLSADDVPDNISNVADDITKKTFWDEEACKPFKITPSDIIFCKARNIPLNNKFYIRRLKENYSWIFFNGGELRETTCAKTGAPVTTTLPKELDSRILSEESYLEMIG